MVEPGPDDAGTIGPTGEEVRLRLIGMLERGTLQPGQKLGAERELAVKLGVSRSTLRQALAALEDAGVVRRVPGRGGGTFIAPAKVERDLSRIVGVPMLLRDQGFTAGSRVVSVRVMTAGPDAAEALGIREQDFVIDLVRIRLADGVPISLEHAVFPAEFVPGLPERELGGSIYELLDREYGLRPDEAVERIEVVSARPDEASILGIDGGRHCCRSRGPRETQRGSRSSTRTTSSAPTARASASRSRARRPPRRHSCAGVGSSSSRRRNSAGWAAIAPPRSPHRDRPTAIAPPRSPHRDRP